MRKKTILTQVLFAFLPFFLYNGIEMDFSTIKELETKYAIRLFNKQNLCFKSGIGARLTDLAGKSYLDFAGGGQNCLGYGDAYLTAAITDRAQRLASPPGEYYSEGYTPVLAKLLSNTNFTKAYLCGGGLEANLTALTLIHGHLKDNGDSRTRVVIAALHEGEIAPSSPNKRFVRLNDFAALKKALTSTTAAFIIQPIYNGVVLADYDYLVNAYALCRSMGIIFFCDETQLGIGATGKKFAFEHYGIQPDITTISQGLAGGLPIGAVLTRDAIAAGVKPTRHGGNNFESLGIWSVGGPDSVSALSCAAASVVLDRLDEGLLENVTALGEYLLSRLYKLTKYNFVLSVRGRGCLAAVELTGRIMAAKVASQMEKLGYLLDYTDGNVLRFSPPFIISKAEIDEITTVLNDLFASTNI